MKRFYLYPLWIRIWHWLNAMCCLILIVTGLSLHFADKEDPFISFELSILIHNIAGVVMALLYMMFIIGNVITRNGIHYRIRFSGLYGRLLRQVRYYLFEVYWNKQHPFPAEENCKFNPLQQLTYLAIMYGLVPPLVISGLLLLIPESIPDELLGTGTILPVALLHTVASYLLFLFMVVHVYIATTGHSITSNYKSMVTGWHEEQEIDVKGGRQ